jgi:hypothetical protein
MCVAGRDAARTASYAIVLLLSALKACMWGRPPEVAATPINTATRNTKQHAQRQLQLLCSGCKAVPTERSQVKQPAAVVAPRLRQHALCPCFCVPMLMPPVLVCSPFWPKPPAPSPGFNFIRPLLKTDGRIWGNF